MKPVQATVDGQKRGQLRSALARRKHALKPVLPSDLPIPGPPRTLDDANQLLAWASYALATGATDPVTARGVSQLCGALIKGLRGNDAAKVAELERIVRDLQAADKAARAQARG